MGSASDAYDNALAEAFVATLKNELIHRQHWHARQRARSAIFACIGIWYNPRRRHSALDYCNPVDYEWRRQQTSAAYPSPVHQTGVTPERRLVHRLEGLGYVVTLEAKPAVA